MIEFNNETLKTLISNTMIEEDYGTDAICIQLPFLIEDCGIDVIVEKENSRYILKNKMYNLVYERFFSRSMSYMDFKFVLTSNTFLTEEKQDILKVEKIDYESLLMPKYVDPNIDNIHYEIVQYAIAVSRFFNKMIGYLQYLYLPNKGILIKQLEYRGYIMYEFYVDGRFDTAFVTDEYDDYNTYEELVKHLIKKYGKYLRFREQDYKCKLKYYADEDEIDGYCYITYTHKFKDKEIIVKSGDSHSENAITKNFIKELNKVLGWNIKYKRE